MADLRVILKRSPFILLFYLTLTTTIGGGAAESHEYPTSNSVERSGAAGKKIDEINSEVLKIVNESVNSSQTNDKVRSKEITYHDNDENSTETIAKTNEKRGNISSLMQLAHANMRGNFRRRRGIEDLVNVVDFLTNHTSDSGQFSTPESAIDSNFNEGHIDGANDQNTNAGELAFGDYNNNKDFEEDYVDTHKDPDNANRDDPGNIAETPSDDPIIENEFSFNYPDDYYWEPAINSDNSEVSPGIEPLITAIEEPSWDEKVTNSTYPQGNPQSANGLSQSANGLSQSANELSQSANGLSQSTIGLPQSTNGFPSKEDNFEDSQQFPEENPLKGSEWMVEDVRGVLVEDGRGLDRLLDQVSTPVQALQLPTSEVPTLSSEAQQGCQVITTAPPVDECGNAEEPHEPGVHLVSLRWREVGIYFTITAFVILAGFGKLVFHKMHWLSSRVPESCLLIVLGVLMGLVVHFAGGTDSSDKCKSAVSFPTFSSQVFFMVLLPPIILEAAYSLHDRCFIDNLGTVIVFAVLGTLMNVFLVGFSLWGLAVVGGMGEITISLTESLVFASLISAVDPVAVLSIFQEIGVNKGLYFLVFGESLLNDGVTVVVYNMFSTYMEMPTIQARDYVLSVVVFFVVVIGGTLIGLVFGVITAVFTKYTDTVRVVEPLALLGLAYLAYITAEIFHFSGIISLIVTGLVQAQYAYPNISQKSYTTVKYFIKMASATSDTIIFMFLGMVLVHDRHVWQTGFVLWTLLLCLVIRLFVTLILAVVTNRHRLHPIGFAEQLILAYGGLRGAVAFSLVSMMPGTFEHKELFITATLVVIIFTVFVQGITVGPMVSFLNVALNSTGPRQLLEEVNVKVVDTMMAGIEEVIGRVGDNKVRESLNSFNDKYFMKWLTIPSNEDRLTKLFEKIAITEHYANLYGPSILIEKAKEELTASRQDLALGLSPYGSHFSVANFAEPEPEMPVRSSLGASLRVLGGSLRRHSSRKSSMAVSVADSRASDRSYTREEDAKILLKAMKNNAFNKLHYTYNKNLVDEENQDMTSHMNWRREHAERLALLAQLASNRPESPAGEGNHLGDGQGGGGDLPLPFQMELLTRDSAADIAEGVSLLADSRNLDAIMNYHRRRNSKKRSLRHSLGADSTQETSTDPNPNSNASSNFNPNPNSNANSKFNPNPNSNLNPNPNFNVNPNPNPNSNVNPNPNPNSNANLNPNANPNPNPNPNNSDTVLNIKEDTNLNPQTDHKST